MTIELKPVKSSQIQSIGYSADTKTLAILFKGGKSAYHYSNVEPAMFDELIDKYPFVKQPEPEQKEGE